jgi:hypothetical protein
MGAVAARAFDAAALHKNLEAQLRASIIGSVVQTRKDLNEQESKLETS